MILRSVSKNVRDQNWFAVGLDFAIVVLGVFLGIQLGNWNEARSERERYAAALDQLAEEIEANREIVAQYRSDYAEPLERVRHALDALSTCAVMAEAEAAVDAGLQAIRGTPGFYPQISAIRDLTEDDALKRLQAPKERRQIQDLRRLIERVDEGSNFVENLPFRNPIEDHPMVGYAGATEDERTRSGFVRRLALNAPLEEACRDEALIEAFYLWERVGGFALRLAAIADETLDTSEAELGF
ncbi:hypothetical protein [Parvularcula lutaonensis]|uniref:Uncharacterized protein n=1 Tax=Parvularcula lutaonensis TaxID=491923 RepID=A0ABV7MDJ9_9PROT|nr:hypothetical protein [Parvularcula lutaonensis]GGY53376.1 hypothetical protein GCM10007148_23270 [Parvularcula lutaonensis]